MGIAIDSARSLVQEAKRLPFHGDLLTLGRQEILFSQADCCRLAKEQVFSLISVTPYSFWTSIGFKRVDSLDASNYEQANVIFDLNSDSPPNVKYDCIVDGGTLEHVFHLPNALKNIHHMLRVGGRVIHLSPMNNYPEHGFVQLSPCFFCDYYAENNYDINTVAIQIVPPGQSKQGFDVPYKESGYNHGNIPDRFSPGEWNLVFVATKNSESTCGKIPQQSFYRNQWAIKGQS